MPPAWSRRVPSFPRARRWSLARGGDLPAGGGPNEAGARRLLEVHAAYGSGYDRISTALLGYGEDRMRAALRALPDGTYRFEDFMEWGEVDVAIRVGIVVQGDELRADFTGSSPPIAANFNAGGG